MRLYLYKVVLEVCTATGYMLKISVAKQINSSKNTIYRFIVISKMYLV